MAEDLTSLDIWYIVLRGGVFMILIWDTSN